MERRAANRKTTENQIKNHLINTLGLSREKIREIAEKFIQETIDRRINAMFENGDFEGMLRGAFNEFIRRENGDALYHDPKTKQWIEDFAKKKLKEFIDDYLEISVKPNKF